MAKIVAAHSEHRTLTTALSVLPLERENALQHGFSNLKKRFHLLLVPGLFGSGPLHWQSQWASTFGLKRLKQTDWENPEPASWDMSLSTAINTRDRADKPILLIGHSLGAVLCARWMSKHTNTQTQVAGAFLVAPADVEQAQTPDSFRVRAFAPLPSTTTALPTTLIASENDPWLSLPRAKYLSQRWGAELRTVGKRGHIGSNEPLGLWEEGAQLLFSFAEQC
uniref:RBBP9/YdeN family alpha/beta hydrolase n=1 Tax=Neokomagataea thailandica TaxID=661190 RepID=UPI002265F904|nr:alpha/beta hydrolase [Neokomagataea thailandica]